MQGLCRRSKAAAERETSEVLVLQKQNKDNVLTKVIEREQVFRVDKNLHGEFDPGSGRTLAACLTHASRTDDLVRIFRNDD